MNDINIHKTTNEMFTAFFDLIEDFLSGFNNEKYKKKLSLKNTNEILNRINIIENTHFHITPNDFPIWTKEYFD